MLGFSVGVSGNRKTPCCPVKGVYVCEQVSVPFWKSLLPANGINPLGARVQTSVSCRECVADAVMQTQYFIHD